VSTTARVARRLAAILAIDMVGFSRLMEADEAGTIARQRAHRRRHIEPVLREHGGRIVKTTAGDSPLAESPATDKRGRDTVSSISCIAMARGGAM
jgi:class 3 adenylate cyclase